MFEPIKINRVLPPHELNARRARKRVLPQPPPVVSFQPHPSPNDTVFNHGATLITHHE